MPAVAVRSQLPRQLRRLALLMLLAAALMPACSFAETIINITGLPDELEENIRLYVGKPLADDNRSLRRFTDSLADESNVALAALGYYAAEILINTTQVEDNTVVTIAVTPNDPVHIENIDIRIEGPANSDPAYLPVTNRLPLSKGSVFVSGDYEATKSLLIDRAQDLGYFNFAFTKNEVRVSRLQLTADIKLMADSGERFTFGPLEFDQDVFSDAFLQRWVPFNEGDPYESGLIGELTQNLQNSGYFQSVRVVPQRDRRYGPVVPVKVTLDRKENNQVRIGLGFATDSGPRTKLTWAKPAINRRGHSAEAELGLSELQQSFGLSYRIPRKNQPLYNFWGIEYGLQNTIDRDADLSSFLSSLNFQRVSRTSAQWIESLFVRWERERSTIGGVQNTTDLILPGFSYSRSRSKGAPFLEWGQAASFQALYGSRHFLSSIDFYKSVVTFKYLKAISNKNTLIGAVQYGAISTNDFERVPASQRFFAGGDRSIRGFRFRDVSPRNADGDVVGGRYLEVMSGEYSYRFMDRWSVAAFVDAGRAFNNFDDAYSVGAGVGIRWQSPVGPFRIDLAKPVSDGDEDRGIRLHLSLGPDL